MALHALYEVVSCSLSRCFCTDEAASAAGKNADSAAGGPPPRTSTGTSKSADYNDNASSSAPGGSVGRRRRDRRAMGLSLRDGEWDVLFDDDGGGEQTQQQPHQPATTGSAPPARDLEYADVAARARMAAEPSQHRTPTKGSVEQKRAEQRQQQKQKQRRQSRERANSTAANSGSAGGSSSEHRKRSKSKSSKTKIRRTASSVFRLNRIAPHCAADKGPKQQGGEGCGTASEARHGGGGGGSSAAGAFFDAFGARIDRTLCFANPIRDESDLDANASFVGDEEQTLNTCEDTITSTLYFEQKLQGLREGAAGGGGAGGESDSAARPPQPLFEQFRVQVDEEKTREIFKIIEDDTHKSHGSKLGIVLAYQEMEARKKILLRKNSHNHNKATAGAVEGEAGGSPADERDDRSQPNSPSSTVASTPASTPSPPRRSKATSKATSQALKKIPPPPPPPPPPAPQCRDGDAGARQKASPGGASHKKQGHHPQRPSGDGSLPSMKLLSDSSRSTSGNSSSVVVVVSGSP